MRRTRGTARRVGWGLADQAVSSVTNFAVGITVARALGAEEFGVFSLVWVTYAVVLNLSRGLATDPLTVRCSGVPEDVFRPAVRRATGTALVVGLVAGAVTAAAGLVAGGRLGGAFVALGCVLPGLLLQDSWRFAFFAAGRGQRAFANDLVWGVALVPAMFLAAAHGGVAAFVLAWGAAALLAAAAGLLQTGSLPQPAGAASWVREHRDLGPRYLVENLSNGGAAQVRAYGLGAVSGLAAVGTVRGAELLMGPFLALLNGLANVSVPEAARVLARSPARLPRFCLVLGGAQMLAALAWGAGLLLLMPPEVGEWLLGAVWPSAAALIVPATLSAMNAGLQTGAMAGLRALGASRRSLRAQLTTAGAYVVLGLVGAALGGALGSAWGVALGTAGGAATAWWQLRAALREHTTTTRGLAQAGAPRED